jgi:hypothetical protein
MLTLRTSAQIPTNQHCRNFHLIRTSTGAPQARGVEGLLHEWTRLLNAERRRAWLSDRWSAHGGRITSKQSRRQS